MKFEQILQILQSLSAFGVPSSATVGAIAAITLKWIAEEKARGNMTDDQLVSHQITVATENELRLLADKARLEAEVARVDQIAELDKKIMEGE